MLAGAEEGIQVETARTTAELRPGTAAAHVAAAGELRCRSQMYCTAWKDQPQTRPIVLMQA